jgi:3-oxoacyl-[acyl-carrier-protein] synthase-3
MKIIGTGSAVPELVIQNQELEGFLETSDEWIRTRTGITERHIHDGRLEELAASAARAAIDSARLSPADIDLILCSTVYNQFMTPGMSCVVQGMIGATCPCLDINGACAGFVCGLELADAQLHTGRYQNILVLAAEEPTRMVDWTNRATCVLFGDAAGAVVVTSGGPDFSFRMGAFSDREIIHGYNTAGNCPYDKSGRTYTPMTMNGQEVYKFAVSHATDDILALCSQRGITPDDVDHFVLHQANFRILEAVRTRLKQAPEKFHHNVEHYGNTSSASVPLLLDEVARSGALKHGDIVAMSAFGAGLTTGSCIFTW